MIAGLWRRLPFSVALLVAVLAGGWGSSGAVQAATLTVTNLDDSGPDSLRQTIADAAPGDTIEFSVTGTITLTSGELAIDKDLAISGPGAADLAISGNNASRVFNITAGNVAVSSLTVRNGSAAEDGGGIRNQGALTLGNVTVSSNTAGTDGGGISNRGGSVTITGSTVCQNTATDAGGGISNRDGEMTIEGSTVCDNTSTSDTDSGAGGGIANHAVGGNATLVVTNSVVTRNIVDGLGGGGIDNAADSNLTATLSVSGSTVSDNVANGIDHTEGLGGGIQNSFLRPVADAAAILAVNNSTVSGNSAVDGGGISSAIDLGNNLTLVLTMSSSTVSGNTAAGNDFQVGNGGGVYVVNGVATIVNSTVSGNAATGTGNVSGLGGGIMVAGLNDTAGTLTLQNTTVTNNSAADGGGGIANTPFNGSALTRFKNSLIAGNTTAGSNNCFNSGGTLTSHGHNLEDEDTCELNQPTDIVNTDPLLGSLADNGGPTLTHALLPGSLAIDAADDGAAPPTDQRGVARPQGAASDIGAFEFVPPSCSIALEVAHTGGNLSLDFSITSTVPTTWVVRLPVQGGVIPLLSVGLPAVAEFLPSFSFPFPALGTVGVITALTTPTEGVLCFDLETVNTGP